MPVAGIEYAIAQSKDGEELLEFLLDYFRVEEPITSSVGTGKEDARVFYEDLVDGGLKGPVSFVARDAESGKLVGCRLNEIVENPVGKVVGDRSPDYGAESTNKVAGFVDDLSAPLYRLLPESRKMMKFIVVGVHPDYFRKGIGSTLVSKSIEKAKEYGCDWITTTATAFRSQKMFEKLGFVCLHQISYADYKKNDQVVFEILHDGATEGKLMGFKL